MEGVELHTRVNEVIKCSDVLSVSFHYGLLGWELFIMEPTCAFFVYRLVLICKIGVFLLLVLFVSLLYQDFVSILFGQEFTLYLLGSKLLFGGLLGLFIPSLSLLCRGICLVLVRSLILSAIEIV